MIELENVTFSYSGHRVLNDVSAGFAPGCFYGIFGPNGCGKSTMLKLITGELNPESGRITPRWRDPLERARRLAVVEQEIPNRIPLTVREIVALGRYPWERGGQSDPHVVDRVLESMRLAELAGSAYGNLSGGERQRVMLARAAAQETPVLLLDEPASSLDIGFQHAFYRMLRGLAEQGKCVVMVSHDLFIAPNYLDEALMLKDGRIFCRGRADEVVSDGNLQAVFQCPRSGGVTEE